MKKQLFGALLGGVLLGACTSDDVLNVSASKDVNSQAPVFTVHFDNGDGVDTRAIYNGGIGFVEGDLLSLYHGVQNLTTSSTNFNGWGNAVYEGSIDEQGGFTYTTKAMVNPGSAVMVWPADIAFDGTTAPVVNFGESSNNTYKNAIKFQNGETKSLTPYMSDIINIADLNDGKDDKDYTTDNRAGYGNHYDIYLKRVGGMLSLALNKINYKADEWPTDDPLKLTAVEIKTKKSGNEKAVFSTGIEIASSDKTPNANKNEVTINGEKKKFANWEFVSKATGTTPISSIRYMLGENEQTADILLLPMADGLTFGDKNDDDVDNDANKSVLGNKLSNTDAIDEVEIVVHTNYGKAVLTSKLSNKEEDKVWGRSVDGKRTTILSGLARDLSVLFGAAGDKAVFAGETIGKTAERVIDVDVTKLELNGLHIKSSKQLVNAMTVLKKQGKDVAEQTTFILDGESEENPYFEMNAEALGVYEEAIKEWGVKYALNKRKELGHVCTAVAITKEGDNVPAYLSIADEIDIAGEEVQNDNIAFVLKGSWNLNGGGEYVNIAALKNEGTLTLTGTINAVKAGDEDEPEVLDPSKAIKLVNNEHGVIAVNTEVVSYLNIDNYGTINIAQIPARLTMAGTATDGAILTNMIVLPDPVEKKPGATGLDEEYRGVINCNGITSVQDETAGQINNNGVIYVGANSKTLITNNGTGAGNGADFNVGAPLSATNIAGIVHTPSASGKYTLAAKGVVGIVKDGNGKNYSEFTGQTANPENLAYLVIKADCDLKALTASGSPCTSLKGWVVEEGVMVDLAGTSIDVKALCLKGYLFVKGSLKANTTLGNYFGEDNNGKSRIQFTGNNN